MWRNNNKVFAFLFCLPHCIASLYLKRLGFIILRKDNTVPFLY